MPQTTDSTCYEAVIAWLRSSKATCEMLVEIHGLVGRVCTEHRTDPEIVNCALCGVKPFVLTGQVFFAFGVEKMRFLYESTKSRCARGESENSNK